MKPTIDVAVIGGGVIGLAVAQELRLAGVPGVLVLERESAVGQGSSARANGGVRAQFTTPPNIEFSRYSIEAFERLQEESNGALTFHQVGYLLLTGTEPGKRGLRAAFDLQRSMGVDTMWLSPADVLELAPFLRPGGLTAGTFHQRDGFLDPHAVVLFFAERCRRLGVTIAAQAEVLSIERRASGGFLVKTRTGDMTAGQLVNAAGADASVVAGMLHVDLPVHPVRRNLAYVQAPQDSLIPMCVDLDTGVLIRREVGGGYIVAYSNPEDLPSRDTTLDPEFLPQLAARIGNRFPFMEELPIDPGQCWAGLYPETPDHHAVIGTSEQQPGFVQCVGFGGHGVMHSPAAARAVADIVVEGDSTTLQLRPLRPTRFDEHDLVTESAVF